MDARFLSNEVGKDQLDFIAFNSRVMLDPESHGVRLFTWVMLSHGLVMAFGFEPSGSKQVLVSLLHNPSTQPRA